MALVYNKLWSLLSTKNITKAKFREMVDLSMASLARLEKNEVVMLTPTHSNSLFLSSRSLIAEMHLLFSEMSFNFLIGW